MITRVCSLLPPSTAYVLAAGAALGGGGGCSSVGDSKSALKDENLISDFEGTAGATVVMRGNPPRNGHWYTYNDDSPKGTDPSCAQVPPSAVQRAPDPPAIY